MMAIYDHPIELVIWDMDEAFWSGTITAGPVQLIPSHVHFLKELTALGVKNSICSKNYFGTVQKELARLGVWEYFVAPSINWDDKGARISGILAETGVKAENAIFIDDLIENIEDAHLHNPGIHTLQAGVDDIDSALQEVVEGLKG